MDYDIFCDESRHIEKDRFKYMVIGGIWCERPFRKELNSMIEGMKSAANFAGELKWTKITPKKIALFKNVIQLFFTNSKLSFRCIVVNKEKLKHEIYNPKGGHEEFFYKMYYYMLNKKMTPPNTYRIFLDYKGKDNIEKIRRLQNIIRYTHFDFLNQIITLMQSVQSKQHPLLQLVDILIGAVGYTWNNLNTSKAKLEICDFICKKAGINTLKLSTPYNENKFEIFKIILR